MIIMTFNDANAELIFEILAIIGAIGCVIAWFATRPPRKHHSR